MSIHSRHQREECTLSDLCIDYLTKKQLDLFLIRTYERGSNEWNWTAETLHLHLSAKDPVSLVGLYMIQEDWEENHRIRKESLPDESGYISDRYLLYHETKEKYIIDYGNTWRYAEKKLIQWGYEVVQVEDSVGFSDDYPYIAEKEDNRYLARDPLQLLGFVTLIQAYGERWRDAQVHRIFTVKPFSEDCFNE